MGAWRISSSHLAVSFWEFRRENAAAVVEAAADVAQVAARMTLVVLNLQVVVAVVAANHHFDY